MGKRIMTSSFIYGEINYSRLIENMADLYLNGAEGGNDKA